jgi:GNAT superfamily N-acetyltransferase
LYPPVRPLLPSDHAAVAALWHSAWNDAHVALFPHEIVAMRTPETFVHRLRALAEDSFVAIDRNIPIAFGAVVDDEIDQFYVERSWRGTGLAKLFLDVLERHLTGRGVRLARIQCARGNDRAQAFYARQGWRDAGVRDLPIWMPDDRRVTHPTHLFEKRLG